MTAAPGIFDPASLGGLKLRNRFIRSATHEGMADADGAPTESLEKLYGRLARGGAGAIVTGYAGVMQQGRSSFPGMLMLHGDALVPAYRNLVDAVHREGSLLIAQLAHCGSQTRSAATGMKTVAPSAVRDGYFNEDMPEELTGRGGDVPENIKLLLDTAPAHLLFSFRLSHLARNCRNGTMAYGSIGTGCR